jgi:DNA-directed RNA polymerase subunit RPC12/RpoP
MIGLTCDKCGRRFTPTDEEIDGYLAQSAGKKYALVLCPHCGHGNKIAVQRLQQTVRRIQGPHSKE